jgi:hypothetical protein
MKSDDLARPIHHRLKDRVRDRPAVAFSPGRAAARRPAHPIARGPSMLDRPEIAAKTFLHQGRVGNRYRPATIAVCYGGTAAGAGCRRGKPRARRGRL